ncbi:MAG TPA: hypothetical protein ENI07_04850 [Desulfobacterales bacterium]|nr:hypothetical protein [Desulfobacterales bacterium]
MRTEIQATTMQGDIEAYEKCFISEHLTATYTDPLDWTKPQTWVRSRLLGFRPWKSPITMGPGLEDATPIELESPFEAMEDLLSDDKKINAIIELFNNRLNIAFAKQFAARIQFLFDASKEEYPDEVAILPESLKNFVSFLQAEPNLKYPDVVLSPSKNICTQWRTAPNRHFAVEFLPTGDAHFVIFAPDPKHPEKTIRISGIVSVDSLIQTAQPHGVLSWCSQ